jgi:hypothetical protein
MSMLANHASDGGDTDSYRRTMTLVVLLENLGTTFVVSATFNTLA